MKRAVAFLTGLLALAVASLALTATAGAFVTHPPAAIGPNGEQPDPSMTLTPRSGSFYQNGFVPGNWKLNVEMHAPYVAPVPPAPQPDVAPLKQIDLRLPTDITFNPKPSMAVCTDAKMNEGTNLSFPPMDAIALCPKSVIGNGTAKLFISHKNTPTGPNIKDPTLIVFNAGRVTAADVKFANNLPASRITILRGRNDLIGRPMIKIHGYSKATTAGIFMRGVLEKNGRLLINVPRLSNDSGVSQFDLNLPGSTPIKYSNVTVPQSVGQDPDYLRAQCSSGSWKVDSDFILGMRNELQEPTSDTWPVIAPQIDVPCTGVAGSPAAKLGTVKLAGPAKAKKGKATAYKLTLVNGAFGDVTGIKVTAKGKGAKGSATGGSLSGTVAKTVTVKVKFTKKGKSKVTFTVSSANGGTKKVTKTVTVK